MIPQDGRAGVGADDCKDGAEDNNPASASTLDKEIYGYRRCGHDEVPLVAHKRHQHVQQDMPEAAVDQDEGGPIHLPNHICEVVQYAVLLGVLERPL